MSNLNIMDYVNISGKEVSRITLGTVQLGLNYGIANMSGKPDLKQGFRILSAAKNGGITSIDTAGTYGDSEEVIGRFSREFGYKFPYITTKFSSMLADGADCCAVESELFSFIDGARKRLNTDKIDCLLLHAVRDMTRHGSAVSDSLQKALSRGMINSAGVSVYNYGDIKTMLNFDVYSVVQLPVNIFDRRLPKSGIIDELKLRGVSVFARSVFFQGLFFLPPGSVPGELSGVSQRHLQVLADIAREEGVSAAQLAAAYVRDLPGISSMVLGAESALQITEDINYISVPAISAVASDRIERELSNIDITAIMAVLAKNARERAQKSRA